MSADPGSTISYAGAVSLTIVGGLTINEWAAIVGIVLGIATFAFNVYWKFKFTERRSKSRE